MAQNPLNPKFPSGTISGNANVAYSLLERLQTQLDPDTYGEAQQVSIQADGANAADLLLAKVSPVAGDISATNYGIALGASGSTTYRSSHTMVAPVSTIRIFSASAWTAHVDINA
jgi:hypothetical protein